MGYHTDYTLEYEMDWEEHDGDVPPELEQQIREYINADEDLVFALGRDNQGGEGCSWYDHEKDMRIMSLQFPTVRFCLEGRGEQHDDVWREHYLNGKMGREEAELTWPQEGAVELS